MKTCDLEKFEFCLDMSRAVAKPGPLKLVHSRAEIAGITLDFGHSVFLINTCPFCGQPLRRTA